MLFPGSLKSMRNLYMIALVVLALAACGGKGDSSLVTTTRQSQSFQISLTTRNTARLGDTVPITFTVKNLSTETTTVMLGGAPEAISQVKQGNVEIWNWATGKAFPAVLPSPQSIAANETRTYDLSWNQKDNAGNSVAAGSYTINAWFNTASVNGNTVSPQTDLAAEPITIVIL